MKIVLSMIARNESHVLRRALKSAKPFVTDYCIVDTGSTDGTQEIIKEYGTLYESPWVDFATNRNQALNLAKLQCANLSGSYILFLDADDTLEAASNFKCLPLTAAGYTLPVHYGDTTYTRCALVRADAPWFWAGVVHEYLDSPIPLEQGHLDEPIIKIVGGGARSLDPEKFKKDAALLEEALAKEPNNARYAFYLAQSYKDAGMLDEAYRMYYRRSQMSGWYEETWYAMYMQAQITGWRGDDPTAKFIAAFNYRPTRLESLYQLARYHRLKNEYAAGWVYAKHAVESRKFMDTLFIDASIYGWKLQEEYYLNAWYVGEKAESKKMLDWLIAESTCPPQDRQRFVEALRWY